MGIEEDELLAADFGFAFTVGGDLGGEHIVAYGEDVVDEESLFPGVWVIDAVDDDGVDFFVIEVVIEGRFMENPTIEVAFAIDLLFGEEEGNGAAGHEGFGKGTLAENGAFFFTEVADGDSEIGVGAVFDIFDGESLFEKTDDAFPAEEAGGLAGDEHGDPAVEEAGIEEGTFEFFIEDEVAEVIALDSGGVESGGEGTSGGSADFSGVDAALI